MNRLDAHGWTVEPARESDLEGLLGFDGAAPAAPAAAEEAWVARPRPDAATVATLRLRRSIGYPVPQAWFRLGWAVHAAAELQLFRRQRTLLLGHDLVGADELTGFAVAPSLGADDAAAAWSALVSAAVRASSHPQGAEDRPCVAQLPGLRDATGHSPVWQGLGRHFHAQELDEARREHGPDWERHVAPLLPRQQVYVSLLPALAQDALGHPATEAEPLRRALLGAGFGWRDHVGIVDGGPVLERWPPGR